MFSVSVEMPKLWRRRSKKDGIAVQTVKPSNAARRSQSVEPYAIMRRKPLPQLVSHSDNLFEEMPRLWRRRSRKDSAVVQTVKPSNAARRSQSVEPYATMREKPLPKLVPHPDNLFEDDEDVVDVVDAEPRRAGPSISTPLKASVPRPSIGLASHHSLPSRVEYDTISVAHRRPALPRQEIFYSPERDRGRRDSRELQFRTYRSSSRERRRSIVSVSPTRRLIIETPSSKKSRSHSRSSHRGHSQSRTRGRSHSRSISGHSQPLLHMTTPKDIEFDPEYVHFPSRISRTPSPTGSRVSDWSPKPYDSPISTASHNAANERMQTTGMSNARSPDKTRSPRLPSVIEAPSSPTCSASTSTTTRRYSYRYIPTEDDNSSIKSFVREIERGGHRRNASAARPSSPSLLSPNNIKSGNAVSRYQTSGHRPAHIRAQSTPDRQSRSSSLSDAHRRPKSTSEALKPPNTPESQVTREASYSPRSRLNSWSRSSGKRALSPFSESSASSFRSNHSRSSSIGRDRSPCPSRPTLRRGTSPALDPSFSPGSTVADGPRPRRAGPLGAQPKFAERFSVCFDPDVQVFGNDQPSNYQPSNNKPSKSSDQRIAEPPKDEQKRRRRINRVLRVAEYAAGVR